MPEYVALADGTKPVRVKNDAGEFVTRYENYSKGDTITLSEEDGERLLAAGGVAQPDAEVPTQFEDSLVSVATPQEPHTDEVGTLPAGLSGQTADEGLRGDAEAEGDSVAPDGEDAFESMSYPQLQAAARERGLSATGSADDLRARLREYTAGTSAEDISE